MQIYSDGPKRKLSYPVIARNPSIPFINLSIAILLMQQLSSQLPNAKQHAGDSRRGTKINYASIFKHMKSVI